MASVLFFTAEIMGVVNIRYAPFLELFSMILAGYGFSRLVKDLRITWLFPFIVILIVVIVVRDQTTYIPTWIKWNYEGFEAKALWDSFSSVNRYVAGSENEPRVVYEHAQEHNAAGTPRAYESLPLFSGRSTLEGLYMQSSQTAPFVFYIQSEISKVNSCPFWRKWPCTSFDINGGTKHLKMFNVQYFIVRSDQVKTALRDHPEYRRVEIIEPYEIYELMTNENKYVIVPKYEPVLFETMNWKEVSYDWFRNLNMIDTPLVFVDRVNDNDREKFKSVITNENLEDLAGIPIDANCNVYETVSNEEVSFTTNCPGKPHIIRISYHPNWYVENADKVYLVSPSFMLVFPNQENVRLFYTNGLIDNLGVVLTSLGILFIIYNFLPGKLRISKFLKR